jgi:NAD(P)-dependent dehydrogenase (short-subunit alcohol dehydrogenase family)
MDGIMNCMFYMAKPVARHMIGRGEGGVIINMTSINAFITSNIAPRYNVPYCVAKAGIAHLTRGMATNWATHKIRVNGVAPGFIITEMVSSLMKFPDIMSRMLAGAADGAFRPGGRNQGCGPFSGVRSVILHDRHMTGGIAVLDGGATLW